MYCPIVVASVKNPPPRFRQCIPSMSHVLTYENTKIFQGDRKAAADCDLLKKNDIRLVVNCSNHLPNSCPSLIYHNIKINDTPEEQFGIRLCDAAKLIESFAKNNEGNVLIHCNAGMSRSSTVTLAFMVLIMEMKLNMAFSMLKQRRSYANPNPGFWVELKALEMHKCLGYCKCPARSTKK